MTLEMYGDSVIEQHQICFGEFTNKNTFHKQLRESESFPNQTVMLKTKKLAKHTVID